jgi:chromosome partitioning protein
MSQGAGGRRCRRTDARKCLGAAVPTRPGPVVPAPRRASVPMRSSPWVPGADPSAMRSIGVVNLKGGSGKTTTALCLAVGAAMRGRRVLLIDADPQANASIIALNGHAAADPTISHVLLDQVEGADAIRPTRVEGLDLLPADGKLADAAIALVDQLGRERRLSGAIRTIEGLYDLVVVDAAPQLSLVTINVLNAVGELLVPVDAGLFSVAGLGRLQESVDQVRRYLDNHALRIAGLVMTRTHANRATRDIDTQLRAAFGSLVHLATIPHSVKVEEAHARYRTVLEFAPGSAPAIAYGRLLTEILDDENRTRNPDAPIAADEADAA